MNNNIFQLEKRKRKVIMGEKRIITVGDNEIHVTSVVADMFGYICRLEKEIDKCTDRWVQEFMNRFPSITGVDLWIKSENGAQIYKDLRDARCFYYVSTSKAKLWTMEGGMTGDYKGQIETLKEEKNKLKEKKRRDKLNAQDKKKYEYLTNTIKNKEKVLDAWLNDFRERLEKLHSQTQTCDNNDSTELNTTSDSINCSSSLASTPSTRETQSNMTANSSNSFTQSGMLSPILNTSVHSIREDSFCGPFDSGDHMETNSHDEERREIEKSPETEKVDHLRLLLCITNATNSDKSCASRNNLLISSNSVNAKRDSVFRKEDMYPVKCMGSFMYIVHADESKFQNHTFKVDMICMI